MKNKKFSILFLLGFLFIAPMAMSSYTPAYSGESDAIVTQEELFNADTKVEAFDNIDLKLDPILSDWVSTDKQLEGVNYVNGKLSVRLIIAGNDATLEGRINPITVVKIKDNLRYIHATVENKEDLEIIKNLPEVFQISADKYFGPENIDPSAPFSKSLGNVDVQGEVFLPKDEQMIEEIVQPHSHETREVIGVNTLIESGYNGSGVVVQVHDTGVDFGHTVLRNAMAVDENGYPLSFEPMGRMSLTNLWSYDYWMDLYHPNDPCNYPESYNPGYTAMFEVFTPRHTDADGYINLAGYNNLLTYVADLGSLYTLNGLGITLPSSYYVGSIPGNLTGFAFGVSVIHNHGSIQFVPYLEADSDDDGNYDTLYVDYESGFALTQWWWTYDESWYDLAPFDFSGQVATKNNENLALSADVWNLTTFGETDGYYDISMGSIANVYDYNDLLDDTEMLLGIPENGKSLGHLWDVGGHGTGCSGYISGDLTEYQLLDMYENPSYEYYSVGGMASEANILATPGFSSTAIEMGWFWAAGFDYNAVSGEFEFNNESTHFVDISSNSWGTSAVEQSGILMGWDRETFLIDLLSVPGFLDVDFPGILFLTSTGNGGSGMGTSKQPSQSTSSVAIGASTVNWWRNTTGYNATQQGNDQVIGWSDNGPSTIGYPKIDVVAPGAFDFSIEPLVVGQTSHFTTIFGGTSASTPVVAGAMALVYQAWNLAHPGVPLSPDMAKVILKSSAKDIGYDPYMQGTGRVDALKAVQLAEETNDVLMAYSYNATATTAGRYINAYYNEFYYDDFTMLSPLYMGEKVADDAIYGGRLLPGDHYNSDLIVKGNTSALDYEAVTFETTYTAVNDSVDLNTTDYYTPFKLEDVFDIAQLRSADYFQLEFSIPFEQGEYYRENFAGNPPYMYVTSLESGTVGAGDEAWAFHNYAYDNNNFQDLFLPTNFIQSSEDPVYVRIRDRGYDQEAIDWNGTTFTLSVRAFTRVIDSRITINDITTNEGYGNFTVDIDIEGGAVPGMYEGYIILNNTVDNQVLVPYGYSVPALVEDYDLVGWTDVSNGEFTGRPNDNGLYGCADWDWRPETGDWRFYDMRLDNTANEYNVSALALELEWVNPGTEMNMWIAMGDGFLMDHTDYLTNGGQYISDINAPETKQRLLVDIESALWFTSDFILIVHSTTMNPTSDTVPLENFTLKAAWLNHSVDDFAVPGYTETVPDNVVTSTGTLVTNSTYSVQWDVVSTNPVGEFTTDAYNNTIVITSGDVIEREETLAADELVPYAGAMVPEYTEDIYLEAGQFVSATLDWDDDSDFDFLLIPYGDPYAFDSDIFGAPAATGSKPEHFEGTISTSGWYEIVVEWYDGPGTDVTFNFEFSILGDLVYEANVLPGNLMKFNLTDAGVDEGTYLVKTSTAGWNFAHTISSKFIYDISAPELTVMDAVTEYGQYNDLEFYVDEATEGTFSVKEDECVLASGDFSGTGYIPFEFYGLTEGVHTLTIFVEDMFGDNDTEEMEVYINSLPVLSDVVVGLTNFTWFVSDSTIATTFYEVTVDGEEYVNGTWESDVELLVDTSDWEEGTYAVMIEIFDGYGKSDSTSFDLMIIAGPETTVTETVTVTVTETETETETTTEEGGGIPGYATGMFIVASLGVIALILKKSKKN